MENGREHEQLIERLGLLEKVERLEERKEDAPG